MIEYAQWTAIFIAFINLFFSLIDKKLIKLFQNKAARDLATGISVESLSPLFRWRLRRMRYSGFVFDSEMNRYYFDVISHKSKQKTRRVRLIFLLVLTITIVLILVLATR